MNKMEARKIRLRDRALPTYTKGEEVFNMVSHIVGGGIGVVALVLGILSPAFRGSVSGVLCGIAFGVSMIVLYTMSSIYHGLRPNLAKHVFRIMDHCTIYLLIAGTYTPILVCSMAKKYPVAAWVTFGVIWGLAALATTLTAIDLNKYKVFSMISYIGMGWAIIFSIKHMYDAIGPIGFSLLLAGGVLYTGGVIFFKFGITRRYFHSIFHIFVILGSISHSLCVLFFAV